MKLKLEFNFTVCPTSDLYNFLQIENENEKDFGIGTWRNTNNFAVFHKRAIFSGSMKLNQICKNYYIFSNVYFTERRMALEGYQFGRVTKY